MLHPTEENEMSQGFVVAGEEKEAKELVRLKLTNHGSDAVMLVATDASGERIAGGNLIHFSPDGINTMPGVAPKIGLERNSFGGIKIRQTS